MNHLKSNILLNSIKNKDIIRRINMNYDYLIVGSGLFGSIIAYEMTKKGKKCLVIEKRDHIGGNVYTEKTENINVHKYGAHIFHTNNRQVWNYINQFADFNRYTNSPVANYRGELYNLPFNMNTFYQMWGVKTPEEARQKIDEQRQDALEQMKADGVTEPRNLEEQALLLIGKDIYEVLIKGYTEKQWGRKCTELPPFIIKRLPVRFVHDNNYFSDRFQGIPMGGFNKLIDGLLKGIETRVNTNFFENRPYWESIADHVLFTGKIDEFFDYRFGQLEWRSVRFDHETLDIPNYQGNAVMNFTDTETPYTRIIEHKHFEMFGEDVYKCPKTVISREYSSEWHEGIEPFYTVNDNRNNSLYLKYKSLSDQEKSVTFGGRLAEYKYYDMAPIIEKVMGF